MSINSIYTHNLIVSSFQELEIEFSQELTRDIVTKSYEKYVSVYNLMIQDGIEPTFKIEDKQHAMDYLLQFYSL
jgi:hypothetical protein